MELEPRDLGIHVNATVIQASMHNREGVYLWAALTPPCNSDIPALTRRAGLNPDSVYCSHNQGDWAGKAVYFWFRILTSVVPHS